MKYCFLLLLLLTGLSSCSTVSNYTETKDKIILITTHPKKYDVIDGKKSKARGLLPAEKGDTLETVGNIHYEYDYLIADYHDFINGGTYPRYKVLSFEGHQLAIHHFDYITLEEAQVATTLPEFKCNFEEVDKIWSHAVALVDKMSEGSINLQTDYIITTTKKHKDDITYTVTKEIKDNYAVITIIQNNGSKIISSNIYGVGRQRPYQENQIISYLLQKQLNKKID